MIRFDSYADKLLLIYHGFNIPFSIAFAPGRPQHGDDPDRLGPQHSKAFC